MKPIQIILFTCLAFILTSCLDFQARELINRELRGPLIKVEDVTDGFYDLYIKDARTKDTVHYTLSISIFVEENKIQKGDSLSKYAGSHSIFFHRKRNGKYLEPVELYYY